MRLRHSDGICLVVLRLAILSAGIVATLASAVHASAPLYDPGTLNIGVSCQWQQRCIKEQNRAKRKALKYVAKYTPPAWRIHLCNRNAARGGLRVDWVGFDHCIRNTLLRPPPPPPPPAPAPRKKRHKRR